MNVHSMQRWGKLKSIYQTLRADKPGIKCERMQARNWTHGMTQEVPNMFFSRHACATRNEADNFPRHRKVAWNYKRAEGKNKCWRRWDYLCAIWKTRERNFSFAITKRHLRRARGRLSVFMQRFPSESPLRGRRKCDLAVSYSIFTVIDKFGKVDVECQLIESLNRQAFVIACHGIINGFNRLMCMESKQQNFKSSVMHRH